ncbi:MAG: RHS repeat-associated core domain-containing protein [Gammaproteobacteria bacterium]|jgi:RHS repeat-associated protein
MRYQISYGNLLFKKLIKMLIAISFCGISICFASSQIMPSAAETYRTEKNYENKTAKLSNFITGFNQKNKKNTEEVGSLSGKLTVNEVGAAVYNVPINVPPGTAGMTPKLSITYSSNQKNGLLGMGFSLEGLTSIIRAPQNKAQNGQIHGVDFTDQDRFSLGGQQLVAIKGDYGQDQTEYRTYIDSQSKIISYGRQGNGPQSFKVWTKGGQIAEYGVSEDARLKAHIEDPKGKVIDDQTVKQWTLDKIEDTAGNYLQVHYFKDEANGVFYPTEIDYTGNDAAGIKPYNKVEFVYADRPDARTLYHAGSKSVLNKRLSEIKVYSGDQTGNYQLVYDYQLTYEISPNTYRSRLTSIKLSDASGNSYPATKFNWQTNDEGWEEVDNYKPPVSLVSNDKDLGVRLVDLTGNGLPDFMEGHTGELRTWINTGNGWYENGTYKPPVAFVADGKNLGVRLTDLNGNGLPDFMKGSYESGSYCLRTWLNTGEGWREVTNYKPPIPYIDTGRDSGIDLGVRNMDINGDGLVDILEGNIYGGPARYNFWINTGEGWHANETYKPPVVFVADGKDLGVRLVDLNGNGLLDFMKGSYVSGSYCLRAWLNTGEGWREVTDYKPPTPYIDTGRDSGIDLGVRNIDINGDGLADVLEGNIYGGPARYESWLNTGVGWKSVTEGYIMPAVIDVNGKDNGVRFLDLNGDDLLDLVEGNKSELHAWLNTGYGFKENNSYVPPVAITYDGNKTGTRFIDLNGNGLVDVIEGHNHELRSWLNKAKKLPDYLIGITDGLGEKTTIDYEPITSPVVYIKEHDAKYPDQDIQMPMYVVYQTSSDTATNDPRTLNRLQKPTTKNNRKKKTGKYNTANQNNTQHITSYHYMGAKINKLGYGFLGFHYVTRTDEATGIHKTTTYSQDAAGHLAHQPVATLTQRKDGTALNDSQITWQVKQYGDGSVNHTYYLPYSSKTVERHYALSDGSLTSTKTTTTQLDDYGNAVDVDETLSGATGAYETHTQNTYKNDPDKWYLGELTKTVVTKSSPNNAALTRTSTFAYDDTTGMLKQTAIEPDDANYTLTKNFDRDKFGNLIKTTISGKDIETRINSVTYDTEGRFILTKTNALGQTESQTIDERFGEPLTVTNLNGLVTTYEYDGFGRKTKVTNPDGTVTTQVYNWCNPSASRIHVTSINENKNEKIKKITNYLKLQSGNYKNPKIEIVGQGMEGQPIKAVYSVTTHTTGGTTDVMYYDQLGRDTASTTQGFDGRIIWKDTFYDDLGRVIQQSVPYFGDSSLNAKNDKTNKTKMLTGEIIGDQAYYTRFKYDVLGRAIETTNPDDSVITVNYDGLTTTTINPLKQQIIKKTNVNGKVIESIDNNGFHTHYKYDSYDNLILMSADGVSASTITYDKLGRKTAIHDPDKGNWNYKYDVLGELISQTDANGNTTTFSYDKLGRMISRTDKGGTSAWTYGADKNAHNVGKLIKKTGISNRGNKPTATQLITAEKDGIGNYTKTIGYNNLSLPETVTVSINNDTYTTSMSYDQYSRLLTTVYPGNVKVKNDYNELGYLEKKENADTGQMYWQVNAMDAAGHVISETHSNGLITTKTYDPRTGFLLNIQTKLSQALALQRKLLPGITRIKKVNQKTENQKAENNKIDEKNKTNKTNETKEPIQTQANDATIVQNLQYSYDSLGNVQTRDNNVTKAAESFNYDNLNRLTAWNANGKTQTSYKYDDLGNLTYKSDVGTYTYGDGKGNLPHAVTSIKSIQGSVYNYKYDNNGNQIEGQVKGLYRAITYTSFDKPNQLLDKYYNSTVTYVYDPDRARFARLYKSGNITTNTYFLGDYQLEVHNDNGKLTISNKYYVSPDTLYINKTDGSGKSQSKETYTLLKDNLGSLTVITTSNADVLQRFSYDPYGNQTQIEGKHLDDPITHEGFTGHETIEGMNLIHMNGRLYDPLLGRFLSADPEVQDPTNSQALNRYSYCLNNPLAYTDPTGYFSFRHLFHDIGNAISEIFHNQFVQMALIIAAACIPGGQGVAGWWMCQAAYAAMATMVLGSISGESNKDILRSGVMSLATAGAFKYAGDFIKVAGWEAVPGHFTDHMLERAAVHGLVGGGLQVAEGGSFKDGFLSAAVAEALPIGSIGGKDKDLTPRIIAERTAAAAIVGGTVAAAEGGNFVNGAKTAAFAELFNDLNHLGADKYKQYKTEQALKMAMGPNSVVIGERPLDGANDMYSNNWSHKHHLDYAHMNVFWTDSADSEGNFELHNVGFFDHQGVISDPVLARNPENINKYRFGSIYHNVPATYNSRVMYQATHPAGFLSNNWTLLHNCQDYVPAVFKNLSLESY